jgi:hypothetical protein
MIKLSIFITIFICNLSKADSIEVDLYKLYLKAHYQSKEIIKSKPDNKAKLSYYNKYFYNEYNVLYDAIGNDDLGDCGSLYLKPSCYLFSYGHEQQFIDDQIGCLNIYARPKLKPEEYLIQTAVLFRLYDNEWKILGHRSMVKLLKDYAHLSFKGKKPSDMFTNICKSSEQIDELQNRVYSELKSHQPK